MIAKSPLTAGQLIHELGQFGARKWETRTSHMGGRLAHRKLTHPPTSLGSRVRGEFLASNAAQKGRQATPARSVESGQQLEVRPDDRIPHAGRDFVDHIEIDRGPNHPADRMNQPEMTMLVEIIPGAGNAIETSLHQVPIGIDGAG